MKIALDTMGTNNAPAVEVEGAVRAARHLKPGSEIILVGPRRTLEKELEKQWRVPPNISIVQASEVITMEDKPVEALRRKRDSSIVKMLEMLRDGSTDAAVSAGNTGAMVAGAKLILHSLEGIDRPAIATTIPSARGVSILIDSGASIDCKPHQLLEFAIMGSEYARFIMKISRPSIGLLSIGTESTKGNELTRETHKLLEKSGLNFIGNVEGRDVFMGNADVIVSDGFVGNIVLKVAEGLASAIQNILLAEIKRHFLRTIGGVLMKPAFMRMRKRGDYSEYGGAPLLGVNGICLICHGSSSAKAIANAIRGAERYGIQEINSKIVNAVTSFKKGENDDLGG